MRYNKNAEYDTWCGIRYVIIYRHTGNYIQTSMVIDENKSSYIYNHQSIPPPSAAAMHVWHQHGPMGQHVSCDLPFLTIFKGCSWCLIYFLNIIGLKGKKKVSHEKFMRCSLTNLLEVRGRLISLSHQSAPNRSFTNYWYQQNLPSTSQLWWVILRENYSSKEKYFKYNLQFDQFISY